MNRIIETERLILRPLGFIDLDDAYEWASDEDVTKYVIYPRYTNKEDLKNWILSIGEDDYEFAFYLKSEDRVIGCGSISFSKSENAYELGYNFNKKYWGNGYATEAANAMLNWAVKELNVHYFTAKHASENIGSQKVLEKCGFQFERNGTYSKIDGSQTFDCKIYKLRK